MPRIAKPFHKQICHLKLKELLTFEQGEVIGAWKTGITERKISKNLNHPQSTVHVMETKHLFPELADRLMTKRDVYYLTKILKQDRKVNLQELHEDFVSSTSTEVCTRSLRNCLHEQGFSGYK